MTDARWIFRTLFDRESSTYTYLLADAETREAALIDPVIDQVERDAQVLEELGLRLVHTFETHVHADHVAGSGVLRQRLGSRSVMGAAAGANCADVMVKDGDVVSVGQLRIEARSTPGHTDGCMSYVWHEGRAVFTGDALLIRGCGRTDFQQGSSERLFHSVTDVLFALPDDYAVYPAHDYKGRTVSSIAEEKQFNPRLKVGTTLAEFVATMEALDLDQPKKIHEAVPANLQCGLPGGIEHASEPVDVERGWAPIERREGVPEVDPAWVAQHREEVRLIDVREPDEFDGPLGHVEGAELFPLGGLERAAGAFDPEAPTITICRSGGRSGKAATQLEQLGFKRVASMRGGMQAWQDVSAGDAATDGCG